MTKILAISDTRLMDGHIHSEIIKLAGDADLVLHAGDFTSQAAYDALKKACKKDMWAVYGSLDPIDSKGNTVLKDSNGKLLPEFKSAIVDSVRIYLANSPSGSNVYSESDLMAKAEKWGVDLMVFGHFNKPIVAWGKKDQAPVNPSSHAQLLVCPGSSSVFKSSFPTVAMINVFAGKILSVELIPITPVAYQDGWRACNKCQALFYGPNEEKGGCHSGGKHYGRASKKYSLAADPNAPGQTDWRWCSKCQCLFYGPNIDRSRCHAKGKHDRSGSGIYTLTHDNPNAPGEADWRWCNKCQCLFYAPNIGLSDCPAGGRHVSIGSGNYRIES